MPAATVVAMTAPTRCLATAAALLAVAAWAGPADDAYREGSEALRAGDRTAAVAAFERATAADPEHVDAWFKLGLARAGLDDADGAVEAYRRAAELDPAHAKALNNVGNYYFRRGRYDEAESWYARALAVDPDYLLALFHHGWVLRHLNRADEAESAFRRCLDAPARERDRRVQLDCLFYLGALRSRAGDWDETRRIMERVVSAVPTHAEARYYLGMAYRRLGRLDDARTQLEIHEQLLQAARGGQPLERVPDAPDDAESP